MTFSVQLAKALCCAALFVLPCSLAAISAANSQDAQATTEITLTYTLVETQISPKTGLVKSSWSRTFRLSGKNVVSKTVSMNGKTLLTESTALGQSGEGVSGINGITYRIASKVVGGAMIMTEESKTYVNTMTIRTDGRTSCSATRVYRLKPGQRVFETATPTNHIPEINSEIHVEDMNCSIAVVR
jgi:hypothetical protein